MYISRKVKNILIAVGVILLAVFAIVGLSKLLSFGAFREVNEDNLYQDLTFADERGYFAKGDEGIEMELLEDNVIKVKGTAESTTTYVIGSTTLKAGTSYVFDSGLENGSKGTIYMSVRNSATDTVIVSSYRNAVVIEPLEADAEVVIEVTIVDETKVNEKIYPVLNEGDSTKDIESFWK